MYNGDRWKFHATKKIVFHPKIAEIDTATGEILNVRDYARLGWHLIPLKTFMAMGKSLCLYAGYDPATVNQGTAPLKFCIYNYTDDQHVDLSSLDPGLTAQVHQQDTTVIDFYLEYRFTSPEYGTYKLWGQKHVAHDSFNSILYLLFGEAIFKFSLQNIANGSVTLMQKISVADRLRPNSKGISIQLNPSGVLYVIESLGMNADYGDGAALPGFHHIRPTEDCYFYPAGQVASVRVFNDTFFGDLSDVYTKNTVPTYPELMLNFSGADFGNPEYQNQYSTDFHIFGGTRLFIANDDLAAQPYAVCSHSTKKTYLCIYLYNRNDPKIKRRGVKVAEFDFSGKDYNMAGVSLPFVTSLTANSARVFYFVQLTGPKRVVEVAGSAQTLQRIEGDLTRGFDLVYRDVTWSQNDQENLEITLGPETVVATDIWRPGVHAAQLGSSINFAHADTSHFIYDDLINFEFDDVATVLEYTYTVPNEAIFAYGNSSSLASTQLPQHRYFNSSHPDYNRNIFGGPLHSTMTSYTNRVSQVHSIRYGRHVSPNAPSTQLVCAENVQHDANVQVLLQYTDASMTQLDGSFQFPVSALLPTPMAPPHFVGMARDPVNSRTYVSWLYVSVTDWDAVEPTTPYITTVSPVRAKSGDTITITGTNFGEGGQILIGALEVTPVSWSDTSATFVLPAQYIAGFVKIKVGDVASNGKRITQIFNWTDAVLTPGTTPIRPVHITELRANLAGKLTAAGKDAPVWSTTPMPGDPIRISELSEIRNILREYFPDAVFTDSDFSQFERVQTADRNGQPVTLVKLQPKVAHIAELRSLVDDLTL